MSLDTTAQTEAQGGTPGREARGQPSANRDEGPAELAGRPEEVDARDHPREDRTRLTDEAASRPAAARSPEKGDRPADGADTARAEINERATERRDRESQGKPPMLMFPCTTPCDQRQGGLEERRARDRTGTPSLLASRHYPPLSGHRGAARLYLRPCLVASPQDVGCPYLSPSCGRCRDSPATGPAFKPPSIQAHRHRLYAGGLGNAEEPSGHPSASSGRARGTPAQLTRQTYAIGTQLRRP